MCRSVLFPTPDAPTIATISPGVDLQIEIAQHGQRRPAHRVALDDAARFEERHGDQGNHETTKARR